MSVRKSDDFAADVERQFEWYAINASWEVAVHCLDAVEATCQLFGQHPQLGPPGGFTHPRLREWRFFVVFRPFTKHVLFYEVTGDDAVMRRAMHGHRDLPRRLIEPPGSG
ncbi:MAG: type II toxin-antitoxin system RelE/ParE family toxin [Pedosphaera sp.]|nr:type II toxin-antitoxin system RelE/ParE family toxin [Pedosphaera sp.]